MQNKHSNTASLTDGLSLYIYNIILNSGGPTYHYDIVMNLLTFPYVICFKWLCVIWRNVPCSIVHYIYLPAIYLATTFCSKYFACIDNTWSKSYMKCSSKSSAFLSCISNTCPASSLLQSPSPLCGFINEQISTHKNQLYMIYFLIRLLIWVSCRFPVGTLNRLMYILCKQAISRLLILSVIGGTYQ